MSAHCTGSNIYSDLSCFLLRSNFFFLLYANLVVKPDGEMPNNSDNCWDDPITSFMHNSNGKEKKTS